MFEAIENGDLASLRQLIDGGAEIDQRDSPLDEQEAKQLRRLFHQFGDMAVAGRPLSRTPLMAACEAGRVEAAELLLEAGANLTLRDALGATPLLLAVEGKRREVVDRLLERGADPDDKDGFGVPALSWAFEAGSLELGRRLLDAGASAAPRCKKSHRPLRALVEMFPEVEDDAGGMIQTFSFGGDEEEDDEDDEPFDPERAMAMVWDLLVKGAKVNDRGLLSAAVMSDEPELIRVLVDAGADWRQPAETGESLIGFAVASGALKVVELLLEWGAEPTSGDGEGSILMMPIASGNVALVKRLIEAGADVEQPVNEDDGETPLMRCASPHFGNLEVLRLLIGAGAEIDRTDNSGRTALAHAEQEGNSEAAALLICAGASPEAAAAAPDPDAFEDDEEEPDEEVDPRPVAERTGAIGNRIGNSWDAILIRRPVAELIAELAAADEVDTVREVGFEASVAEPLSDLLWLVELAGQRWTLVTERTKNDPARAAWLSTAAGARSLFIGYNDTACATFYQLFENGEQLELFESTGEDFYDEEWDEEEEEEEYEEEEMLATRFESKLRDPAKVRLKDYENEDAFVEDFLKSQRAYVPMLYVEAEDGRLSLDGYPDDVLSAETVRSTAVVTLAPQGIQKRWRVPGEAQRALFEALRQRDGGEALRAALAADPDLRAIPPRRKQTALGAAGASPEKVKLLLEAGADPDDGGETPCLVEVAQKLSLATRDGLETMRLLLEAGADPNLADASGRTPLTAALLSLPGVQLLLKSGADPSRGAPLEHAKRLLAFRSTPELEQVIELLETWQPGESEIEVSADKLIGAASGRGVSAEEILRVVEAGGMEASDQEIELTRKLLGPDD